MHVHATVSVGKLGSLCVIKAIEATRLPNLNKGKQRDLEACTRISKCRRFRLESKKRRIRPHEYGGHRSSSQRVAAECGPGCIRAPPRRLSARLSAPACDHLTHDFLRAPAAQADDITSKEMNHGRLALRHTNTVSFGAGVLEGSRADRNAQRRAIHVRALKPSNLLELGILN